VTTKINVDIISDVSCPWCIIGYKSFSTAVDELALNESVELNWMPFELNPGMGPEGQNRNEHIREKYGLTQEQGEANRQNLIDRGLAVGYEFSFPENGRVYNTFNAHRLIHWAKEAGMQTELKLALFDMFFQQQGNPSNIDDLLTCVENVGLEVTRASAILHSDEYVDQVSAGLDFAFQNGISGVPSFIFNKKYLISGGQPKEVFMSALQEMSNEQGQAST